MWRDTALKLKLFNLDIEVLIFIIPFILRVSYFTLFFAMFGALFFSFLNKRGYSFIVLVRLLRNKFFGNKRPIYINNYWKLNCYYR